MPLYLDQLQREINIDVHPQRIVSLVPSQTELLFDLGLDHRIAGCTKYCIHPKGRTTDIVKVGGTKQLDMKRIYALSPDLIIANKEENNRKDVEELASQYPVWISDIQCLDDALEMINLLGQITGSRDKAKLIIGFIQQQFSSLNKPKQQIQALYLIWRKPYMAAGSGTFINDMMNYCGISNAVNTSRYPALNITEMQQLSPQLVLLSSEPYPFKQKHVDELQKLLPNAKILLVDGEMFSWYGSRLQYAPAYFHQLRQALYIE